MNFEGIEDIDESPESMVFLKVYGECALIGTLFTI